MGLEAILTLFLIPLVPKIPGAANGRGGNENEPHQKDKSIP